MRKIDVRKHAATTCRPISDDQSRTLSSATNDAFRVSPVAIGFLFFYFKRNTFKVNSYPANHIHTTHLYTTSTKKKKRSKVNDKKWQAFSCNGRWRTRSSSLFFAHPKKSLRLPFSIHFFVPCLRVVAVRDVRTFNWWGADRILIEMIGRLISCDSGGALIKFRRYLFVRSSASASFLFFFFFFFFVFLFLFCVFVLEISSGVASFQFVDIIIIVVISSSFSYFLFFLLCCCCCCCCCCFGFFLRPNRCVVVVFLPIDERSTGSSISREREREREREM